jgi:hypothetical protein
MTAQQKRDAEDRRSKAEQVGYLVLYMTEEWTGFGSHEFLGWKEIEKEDGNWGAEMGGKSFTAVHVFNTLVLDFKDGSNDFFHWGDDSRDTSMYAHANPWVLMFYGNDNYSCFTRHPDRQSAIDAFNAQTMPISRRFQTELMFYNS